jgi:hypothetical protein
MMPIPKDTQINLFNDEIQKLLSKSKNFPSSGYSIGKRTGETTHFEHFPRGLPLKKMCKDGRKLPPPTHLGKFLNPRK